MIGFLCATPYHVLTSIIMATGEFADKESVLVIMDHAAFDEAFIEKVKSLDVFSEVYLYKSNKKTKLNNVKRLINAFFPPEIMKRLAAMDFERFFCLALDFIDVTYLIKKFEARGVQCEFSYADDGIGSYINEHIYDPRIISEIILRLNGRKKLLDKIKKLYVYKPEYVICNPLNFEIIKIRQTKETAQAVKRAARILWPLDTPTELGGKILYFEQPHDSPDADQRIAEEVRVLSDVTKQNGLEACIKMHPRSAAEQKWAAFSVIKTQMPFEAMLSQQDCSPLLMMSNCSTALFSPYLYDCLGEGQCETIMLYKLGNTTINDLLAQFVARINARCGRECIHSPENEEELQKTVAAIVQHAKQKDAGAPAVS